MSITRKKELSTGGAIAIIVFLLSLVGSWFTHIIYCLKTAQYLLLIAGAIVPPVGVIHGFGVWLGFGW